MISRAFLGFFLGFAALATAPLSLAADSQWPDYCDPSSPDYDPSHPSCQPPC